MLPSPVRAARAPAERYRLLDALRGGASVAVLCHHLLRDSALYTALHATLPAFFIDFFGFGGRGVEVFFVLSGFVIAHSLRHNPMTGASIGNFVVRRQLRLDPPYWCVLALMLALQWVQLQIPALQTPPLPSLKTVALNLIYLHNIIGAPQISDVAWTLCIEIQFYLVFLLILWVGRGAPKPSAENNASSLSVALTMGTGLAALALKFVWASPAVFTVYWHYFAGGALCYWAWRGLISPRALALFGLAFGVSAAFSPRYHPAISATMAAMLTGLFTIALIYLAAWRGQIARWGDYPALQYLGRISYSLYLIHLPVLLIVMNLGYKITRNNGAAALIWAVIAGVASVGAAHLLYLWVEKPSIRWASQVAARARQTPGQVAPHEPIATPANDLP